MKTRLRKLTGREVPQGRHAGKCAIFCGLLAGLVVFVGLAGTTARGGQPEETPAEPEEPAAGDDEKLPMIDKLELPSFARLMQGPAIDWVVLNSKRVIECEPVFPRPGALEDIDRQSKAAARKAGEKPESEAAKRRRMALAYLPVTLLEGDEREYRLHVRFIKEIIYYEDLMLRRVDQLLDDRKVRQAYELLTALEERHESWPGVTARKDRVLFTEAVQRLDERQPQHALALLEALFERNRTYAGLEAEFGKVADALIAAGVSEGDLRASRFFIKRLARRFPTHAVVKDWTARLTRETRDLLDKSTAAERAGRIETALDLAEAATHTWPELPEVLPIYNRLAGRFPRLRVGVVDLPEAAPDAAPVLLSPALRRRRMLVETSLFEPARLKKKAKTVAYETKFFNEWEPTELGHSVLFRLRPWRASGASQPGLTAAGLFGVLGRRLDPQAGEFDARFAAAVESLEVRTPFELMVRFRQVPLRPESLFAFPISPVVAGSDDAELADTVPTAGSDVAPPKVTWPFEFKAVDDRRAVYRRTIQEPEAAAEHHVAEVVELRYDSYDKAIQGLLRGEVSYMPHVPVSTVRALELRKEFFTQPYSLPTTHVLQFNPYSRALAARTLRRALVYALDRRKILEEVFLHESAGDLGRVTSAPFATTSYAYNPAKGAEPYPFDPALAFSLAKTAEKELGMKLPVLKMLCSSEPEIQAAAARLVEQWKACGIEVTRTLASAASLAEGNPDGWDIVYRTETLAEPLVDLWPFLALTSSTETSALGYLPTWLRQELLDLDRVGDWQSARRLLQRLHKQFWAEVHLIPLWEIDDFMVYRKNVRGVPDAPVNPYQRVDRWKIEPWFSKESPL